MGWHALVHTPTGRLLSVGTRVAAVLPVDVEDRPLAARPDFGQVLWDETTQDFVARPAPVLFDRLQDLIAKPGFVTFWQSLNQTQKGALRNGLIWLLGGRRFRRDDESPELEEAP